MKSCLTKKDIIKILMFFTINLSLMIPCVWAGSSCSRTIMSMAETMASDIAGTGKTRVAVAKIMSEDKKSSRFGLLVSEKLTNGLIQKAKGRYFILERELVDRIMGERVGLTAEEAQKLLAADILITGTYIVMEDEVDLSVRAIDLTTAKAVAASSGSIPLAEVKNILTVKELGTPGNKKNIELSLHLEISAFKKINGKEEKVIVKSGDTLYSGDRFEANLMADKDCYLYVFLYNSQDHAEVLFPNPKIALNTGIKGKIWYKLPGGDLAFQLDNKTGMETLYFVASLKPMDDISKLLIEMEKAGKEGERIIGDQLKKAIGTRGITVATFTKPSTSEDRQGVMAVVKGIGSVVNIMEIQHK